MSIVQIPLYSLRKQILHCRCVYCIVFFEGGQPTQENLVPIQVVGKPRDAMMGWVAVDKSGQRRCWCVSTSGGNEEGKSVLEKAAQAPINPVTPVGLLKKKAGWYIELLVEKLEFFLLGVEVLKIGPRTKSRTNSRVRMKSPVWDR